MGGKRVKSVVAIECGPNVPNVAFSLLVVYVGDLSNGLFSELSSRCSSRQKIFVTGWILNLIRDIVRCANLKKCVLFPALPCANDYAI